ncbi:MAG: hypothetical protein NTY12_03275 [Candidatus Falkowbacteria bacterium]|nr:hypothetical protein [Candidatus Falkowbacteria bacterium]
MNAQNYTEKKKVENKTVVKTESTEKGCDSVNSTFVGVIKETSLFHNKTKKTVTIDMSTDENQDENQDGEEVAVKNSKKDKRMSDYYPVINQVEGYIGYVSLKNLTMKFSGANFWVVVRQNPNTTSSATRNVKTFGGYIQGGKYKGTVEDNKPAADITVDVIGGGLSYAWANNLRSGWNGLVMNFGVSQEIENGTAGLYQWRQNNLYFDFSGWADLTRTRNTFFSRSNISWYWKKVISADRSALYNGQTAKSEVYEKEAIGLGYRQTIMQFIYNGNVGIHFILNFDYTHFVYGSQDWYKPGAGVELYSPNGKICDFVVGKNIRANGGSSKYSVTEFKFTGDVIRLAESLFGFKVSF